ncbi:MAG: polyribonucleotide nucleotidyltransferase [bacterium]|nr:polyribonucleotide nucleotidyltransferase [bacterium]
MAAQPHTIKLQDKTISLELTDLAEQANGSVLVRQGDTVILVTAVAASSAFANQGFFPLTVDYEERFYAAGKILGSRFVRREGRPADEAIITARLIDRAIRPLFPKGFRKEVQVIVTCLSWDAENDSDVLGLLGASLSLSVSDIPWQGPVGAVRIAKIQDAFVVNPTYEQRKQSPVDFVLAGVKEKGEILLNMIEAEGQEVAEDVFEQALEFAKPFLSQMIDAQEEIAKKFGKEKVDPKETPRDEELERVIKEFLGKKLEQALFEGDRKTRMGKVNDVQTELLAFLQEQYPAEDKSRYAKDFFEEEVNRVVHEAALKEGKRVDDRKLDEIRELEGRVGILPRTHGTGLFLRGQTKTLSILTLGAPGDQKLMEGMEFSGKKRFMHHYNFPPYAPGEVKPLRGPGRRDIGHGILAEKALLPVIPEVDKFPYTIRIVTEVLSSNGSTSMASCCSASLALMDAGVPIKNPVAGISIGLMQDDKGDYKLLCDIQGPEDHHGDMDFKVAGTKDGITAIQMDVKLRGITSKIFKEALALARDTRHHILQDVIAKVLDKPRAQLSPWAPRIIIININPEKIGLLIGPGGKTINKIIEETGVQIDIEETGQVFITADKEDQGKRALEIIEALVREVKVGEIYKGKVKRIMEFGAFVEVLPGQEGLVHISKLANRRVEKVTDIVKIGDVIPVKVVEIDEQGRINLSLKDAQEKPST